jgi:DNA repair protein RadC
MEKYERREDAEETRRLTIKELPPDERPRERLLAKGAEALTEAELLAIIIRDGTRRESALDLARRLLAESGNSLRELSEKTIAELCKTHGIGPARAAQVKAALALGGRLAGSTLRRGQKFTSSEEVYAHFYQRLRSQKQECFYCLLLDVKNRVLREVEIFKGGLSVSLVNPRDVLQVAVAEAASAIIVVHNHPSGDPEPSADDIRVTKRIREACELTGIRLLDHVIVGEEGYASLAELKKL